MIREIESGRIISKVSKKYTLIQNERIFKPFIERFGIESVKMFVSYGKGKYATAKFDTGRKFNFGTLQTPDIVNEQILVRTSYDKTKSFSFMMGAFRWACLNMMYSGQMVLSFRKIHVGYIPVDEIVNSALTHYNENSFSNWEKLKAIDVTPEKAQEVMRDYKIFPNLKDNYEIKRMNEGITASSLRTFKNITNLDVQKNGWGLYNTFNRRIGLAASAPSRIDSVVTANKRLETHLLEKL